MTSCQVQINRNHHKLYLSVAEGTWKEPRSIRREGADIFLDSSKWPIQVYVRTLIIDGAFIMAIPSSK